MVICTLEMKLRFHTGSRSELAKRNTRRLSTDSLPRKWSMRNTDVSGKARWTISLSSQRRGEVAAEGLLHHDPRALVELLALEPEDHVVEQLGRHGEVEERALDAEVAQPVGQRVERRRGRGSRRARTRCA